MLISPESLRTNFSEIIRTSNEDSGQLQDVASPEGTQAAGPGGAPGGGKTPHLDQYTVDMTELARQGRIDPIRGRDPEIRQIIDVLLRRRQNNPILTGEAGVGIGELVAAAIEDLLVSA